MSTNAEGGSGNPSSGGASGNASGSGAVNPADIEKLINDAVSKALGARMKRLNIEETIAQSVEKHLEKIAGDAQPAQRTTSEQPAGNHADGETKLTLKALQEQIAKLNQGIQERDRKVQEAEQRAREVRLRSDVQAQFAKHLGADSPHLAPYVNQYMAQFADHEGQTVRKTKNEYGEDMFVPAHQAVEEMFKGELKHLVQNSKAPNLPRAQSFQGLTGNPFINPIQPQVNGQELNPILGEFARHFANNGDVAVASAIASSQPASAPKK